MKERIIGKIDNQMEVEYMNKTIEMFSKIEGLKALGGCSEGEVQVAEKSLGLVFPEEYKDYLLGYGTVRFNGIELCGLNVMGYLNVVEATEQEKSINDSFPDKMFVIEDLGVDAKLIVGDEKGCIYLLQRDKKRLVCTSFLEYIEKCLHR